jgi:hypothetical protein
MDYVWDGESHNRKPLSGKLKEYWEKALERDMGYETSFFLKMDKTDIDDSPLTEEEKIDVQAFLEKIENRTKTQ